jgi:hypothetical protein
MGGLAASPSAKVTPNIAAHKLVFLGSHAERLTPQSHQGHMIDWKEGFLGKAKINRLGSEIHGEGVASRSAGDSLAKRRSRARSM